MTLMELPPWSKDRALHVVVETPRGARVKVKLDPGLGCFTVTRPLPAGMVYPFDFGFVPGTRGEDGDPLDAMVCWDATTWPGIVLECRLLGVIRCDQARKGDGRRRQRNDRLLVVPTADARSKELRSALDFPARLREELGSFFVASTALEGKDVHVLGWKGPADARRLVATHSLRGSERG
jgi:inorganic pyrophosphatase